MKNWIHEYLNIPDKQWKEYDKQWKIKSLQFSICANCGCAKDKVCMCEIKKMKKDEKR